MKEHSVRHTVAICSSRGRLVVEATIRAVLMALVVPADTEIVLVGNGRARFEGTDAAILRSMCEARETACTITHCGTPGVSAARNLALGVSRGEFITLLDDDAHPVNGAWQAHPLEIMAAHPEVGFVAGPVVLAPPTAGRDPWWRSAKTDGLYSCTAPNRPSGYISPGSIGCGNSTYRRAAIAGLRFDERLGWDDRRRGALSGEDVLFNLVMGDRGWKAWFDPAAAVTHHIGIERYRASWVLHRASVAGRAIAFIDLVRGGGRAALAKRAARRACPAWAKCAIRCLQWRWRQALFHLCDALMYTAELRMALVWPQVRRRF